MSRVTRPQEGVARGLGAGEGNRGSPGPNHSRVDSDQRLRSHKKRPRRLRRVWRHSEKETLAFSTTHITRIR